MAGLAAIGIVAAFAALSVYSASGQTGAKPDARPAPKRVQDILNDDGKATPGTYIKTYYVGDLLGTYGMGNELSQAGGDTRRLDRQRGRPGRPPTGGYQRLEAERTGIGGEMRISVEVLEDLAYQN
jgi:hypothetical protein